MWLIEGIVYVNLCYVFIYNKEKVSLQHCHSDISSMILWLSPILETIFCSFSNSWFLHQKSSKRFYAAIGKSAICLHQRQTEVQKQKVHERGALKHLRFHHSIFNPFKVKQSLAAFFQTSGHLSVCLSLL